MALYDRILLISKFQYLTLLKEKMESKEHAMQDQVIRLIETDDEQGLRALFRSGALMSVPAEEKALWAAKAAREGRASILRALCEGCHALPTQPDRDGNTLLHLSAASGNAETIRFVLQVLGMDPLQGNHAGMTPLEAASEEGRTVLEELTGLRLADCYHNPVLRGFRPDPSILRVSDDYYAINSSFVYLPALPISHSRDLVHWETIGHVFTDPETSGLAGLPGGFGYWAPDLSYHEGRFWVVATLRRHTVPLRLQMITSATSPEGPWDTPKFLDVDGIDPSIFTDADGQRYLVINPGVQIAPLSSEGELLAAPHMIFYGCNRLKSEGPHLLRRGDWYYIIQAEGGTGAGHMVSCARSRSLEGPYEPCPFGPILGAHDPDAAIGRSGHGKLVELPDGRWAILYLCSRRVSGMSLLGRETALDPVTWTADGWPMVNSLRGPSVLQKKLLPDAPVPPRDPWVCPRQHPMRFAEIWDGRIVLQAGGALTDPADAHLLLHRQKEAAFTQSCVLDASQLTSGMAGLIGYYDENSFVFFGVQKTEDGASALVLMEQIGKERRVRTFDVSDPASIRLACTGKGLNRTYAADEKSVSLSTPYLTDEGLRMGKRFTGAMLGLACSGTGMVCFASYREAFSERFSEHFSE